MPRLPLAARRSPGTVLGSRIVFYVLLTAATLLLWSGAASLTHPMFLPSPLMVITAFVDMYHSGELVSGIGASYYRVLAGWLIGAGLGVPVGLLIGWVPMLRRAVEPYVQFFRFVPPIAFVTLAVIWLGLGEASKISLIVYTTTFIVVLNTMVGVFTVEREKLRAAACLGARPVQVILHVVIPATIPHIITGMRLGMGNSFMTVVSAEMVAAESGIGYLIYNARLFMQTDRAFAGIITVGTMGLIADFVFRWLVARLLYRYQVKT